MMRAARSRRGRPLGFVGRGISPVQIGISRVQQLGISLVQIGISRVQLEDRGLHGGRRGAEGLQDARRPAWVVAPVLRAVCGEQRHLSK